MIIDFDMRFSAAQAVTSTAVGTNSYDLALNRAIGIGRPMAVLFTINVAADQTSGDEDYTFQVESATNAAQSAGRQIISSVAFESGTPTAPAKNADLLVAGYRLVIPLTISTLDDTAQFLGIRYVTAGTTPTITVTADLMPMDDIEGSVDYANNYVIS